MRVGRGLFRNTPLQRLPIMTAIYTKLVRSAYGTGDGTTVIIFRGTEIEIPTGDITTLPTLADGSYESEELNRFLELVVPGSIVADIGANIGIWSVLLSRAVGSDGRVLAFEPSPGNTALLKSNLERNGCSNVDIVPVAVGRATGRSSLDTTSAGATHRLATDGSSGDTPVDVVSLDEYARENGLRIDAVKIDIEGYEPEAFRGMRQVVGNRPLLLTEFSVPQAKSAGTSWGDALDHLLETYGSCEVFDGRHREKIDASGSRTILESHKLLNLLFTPAHP